MNIINTKQEMLIVILSIIGIVSSIFLQMIYGNYVGDIYIQLTIFFIFVMMFSLQLKATIYFSFIFAAYFLFTGSIIFAFLLAYIVFNSLDRWNRNISVLNPKKINLYHGNYEMLQRYTMLFIIFVVIDLVFMFIFGGVSFSYLFSVPVILNILINVSLLITIYTSMYPIVEALYFYLIAVICQVLLLVYFIVTFSISPIIIIPNIIMLFTLYTYYTIHKKR